MRRILKEGKVEYTIVNAKGEVLGVLPSNKEWNNATLIWTIKGVNYKISIKETDKTFMYNVVITDEEPVVTQTPPAPIYDYTKIFEQEPVSMTLAEFNSKDMTHVISFENDDINGFAFVCASRSHMYVPASISLATIMVREIPYNELIIKDTFTSFKKTKLQPGKVIGIKGTEVKITKNFSLSGKEINDDNYNFVGHITVGKNIYMKLIDKHSVISIINVTEHDGLYFVTEVILGNNDLEPQEVIDTHFKGYTMIHKVKRIRGGR